MRLREGERVSSLAPVVGSEAEEIADGAPVEAGTEPSADGAGPVDTTPQQP
jgi:hypothetical protein